MTEHLSKHPSETPLHFATSTDPGYALELLALPEFQARDLHLSAQLADRFAILLEYANIRHCHLQVIDGYKNEPEPHYQLHVRYNHFDDATLPQVRLSTGYSAIADSESYQGSITIDVSSPDCSPNTCQHLEKCAFDLYNDLMTEIYPEWKTNYDQSDIQFLTSISQ